MQNLIPVSTIAAFDNEPRILDLDLAKRLGMLDPHKVRTLIATNREELEMHGEVSAQCAETTSRGGRPGKAYYLNEGQALVICALSRTPIAAKIRKALIDVFQAYRAGKIVHVKEHRRRAPVRKTDSAFDNINNVLQHFKDQPEALIEVLARCVARLDSLENNS